MLGLRVGREGASERVAARSRLLRRTAGWRTTGAEQRSGKGNQRPVGGARGSAPPMDALQLVEHVSKYVFPKITEAAVCPRRYITVNFPYMAARICQAGQGLAGSCLHLHGVVETYLLLCGVQLGRIDVRLRSKRNVSESSCI